VSRQSLFGSPECEDTWSQNLDAREPLVGNDVRRHCWEPLTGNGYLVCTVMNCKV
jgi:hypothetical protein